MTTWICLPWGGKARRRGASGVLTCPEGAAILEFAIALPILFALLAGAFELGRALLIRQIMVEAVRGGARYLARVPDPTCRITCSPDAARAADLTLDQILQNTGLPRASVTVSPQVDVGSETVSMRADLRLNVDLLRMFGLGPVLNLEVEHQERRIAG